jgi:glycosyltransferase involved in cell wall biosynthesis
MLRNRIYYRLKPFIPQSVRTVVRQRFARRLRPTVENIWPIMPGSERAPQSWFGWPDGKKFALVLTHDVESATGLPRCRQLMNLEIECGMRSSFNFIPAGRYRVSPELREQLTQYGFEVGIHDLRHDGRLFNSRRGFARKAVRINQYVRDWNASGFRSAFMLHKLDWLHDLNVEYDASTFDTDPFEPQPEGRHTIFPFWVPAPGNQKSEVGSQKSEGSDFGHSVGHADTWAIHDSRFTIHHLSRGYVELPYTLPQDSTLFILLGEKTTNIWQRKLDWIAQHGGMALLITHPDYMSFSEQGARGDYPATLYREFIEYAQTKYAGQFWHAVPREVAAYLKSRQPGSGANGEASIQPGPVAHMAGAGAILSVGGGNGRNLHGKRSRPARRVVMLVENYFPQDTRVRNEALLLKSVGYKVAVVCYRKPDQSRREEFDGINVYRISRFELFQKTPSGETSRLSLFWLRFRSLVGYLIEYFYFTTACFINCVRIFLESGFDVIHAHNPPDTLFLVALPFKLFGKKFVFDHHDLCPELYQSRYSAGPGVYTNVLRALEWCSLKLADVTVATNNSYKEIEIERGGVRPERIFIVRNGPSRERMTSRSPSERLRRLNKTILCYVGSLNPQDGVDYLLRALDRLKNDLQRDDFYCVIIGDGDSLRDLRALAAQLRLNGCLEFTGFIPDKELLANLAAADICVDPDPASPLNNVSTWIKIMEYMAHGKPIVSFDLKETRFSAQDAALFVPPNDELAFARAIVLLMDDSELRRKLGSRGRERVEKDLQWSVTGQNLLVAYQTLSTGLSGDKPDSRLRDFS